MTKLKYLIEQKKHNLAVGKSIYNALKFRVKDLDDEERNEIVEEFITGLLPCQQKALNEYLEIQFRRLNRKFPDHF